MVVFVTLAVDSDELKHWLSVIGIARIFRKASPIASIIYMYILSSVTI